MAALLSPLPSFKLPIPLTSTSDRKAAYRPREAMSKMGPNREPSEQIWSLVLPYLSKSKPSALSLPGRNALRNQDLCNAALTCKLFSAICEPILYLNVITDDLPLFLRAVKNPSSRRLYNFTRTLWIEYSPLSSWETYPNVLKGSGTVWSLVDLSDDADEEMAVKQCAKEIRDISTSLEWAADAKAVAKVFPRLETLAIAPIYGEEDRRWRFFSRGQDHSRTRPIFDCGQQFSLFLQHLPNLQHFCQRSVNAPLVIPGITFASRLPKVRYTRTVHHTADVDKVFLPFGDKIRWTCDAPMDTSWEELVHNFTAPMERLMDTRELKVSAIPSLRDKADVELYCSSSNYELQKQRKKSREEDRAEQRRLAANIGGIMQRYLRETVTPQVDDIFKWLPAEDTPICPACGSGPPAEVRNRVKD